MKTKPIQRSLSLLSAIALLLTVLAVPASAAARAQADVLTDDLVASGQRPFEVEVTNQPPDLSGLEVPSSLDAVVFYLPSGIIDPVIGATEGWNSFVDSEMGLVYFTAEEGNAIPFGESQVFSMTVDVAPVADDITETIAVQVSSNGGGTSKPAAGDLDTVLRILGVSQVSVVKPSTATNADATQVTAGQDNALVQAVLENQGTEPRTVTVTASKKSGSSSITSAAQSVTLLAGGTETVRIPATFGSAGDLVVEVAASSENSQAAPASSPTLAVQEAVSATYTDDSLSPTTVVPGNPVQFTASLSKTGVPALSVDQALSTLTFETFSAGLASPATLDGGDQSVGVTYNSTTVPTSIPDGDYTPAIRLVGTDGNGATVDVPVAVSDTIKLDRALPVVIPTISGASSRLADADPAVTNGTDLTFGGKVYNDSDQSSQCGTCLITGASVVEYGANGTEVGRQPVDVKNSGGNLEGEATLTYAAATRTIRLEVSVAKLTGLAGTGTSDVVAVDTIAPFATGAATGRDANGDFIAVDLNELIGAPAMTAADWSVDDNQVVTTQAQPNPITGATTVTLRLARKLTHDNVQPAVRYEPADGARAYDRVDLKLANQALNAADGVIPEIPTIATVAGKAKQDGAFYTNDSTPDIEVSNLVQGDLVQLFIDRNGDGQVDSGDTKIGEGSSFEGEDVVITASSLGTADADLGLLAQVKDGSGNTSPARLETLVLDFTAPTALRALVSGNTVEVEFNEPLAVGRNHTFDWNVLVTRNGTQRTRPVNEVAGSGDSRQLTVDEQYYTSGVDSIDGAIYRLRSETDRYLDRAGNALADFSVATS